MPRSDAADERRDRVDRLVTRLDKHDAVEARAVAVIKDEDLSALSDAELEATTDPRQPPNAAAWEITRRAHVRGRSEARAAADPGELAQADAERAAREPRGNLRR